MTFTCMCSRSNFVDRSFLCSTRVAGTLQDLSHPTSLAGSRRISLMPPSWLHKLDHAQP